MSHPHRHPLAWIEWVQGAVRKPLPRVFFLVTSTCALGASTKASAMPLVDFAPRGRHLFPTRRAMATDRCVMCQCLKRGQGMLLSIVVMNLADRVWTACLPLATLSAQSAILVSMSVVNKQSTCTCQRNLACLSSCTTPANHCPGYPCLM
eukprot:SAG31_NODE_21255_length_554_cov_0.764835_1_plen_149_part_10